MITPTPLFDGLLAEAFGRARANESGAALALAAATLHPAQAKGACPGCGLAAPCPTALLLTGASGVERAQTSAAAELAALTSSPQLNLSAAVENALAGAARAAGAAAEQAAASHRAELARAVEQVPAGLLAAHQSALESAVATATRTAQQVAALRLHDELAAVADTTEASLLALTEQHHRAVRTAVADSEQLAAQRHEQVVREAVERALAGAAALTAVAPEDLLTEQPRPGAVTPLPSAAEIFARNPAFDQALSVLLGGDA